MMDARAFDADLRREFAKAKTPIAPMANIGLGPNPSAARRFHSTASLLYRYRDNKARKFQRSFAVNPSIDIDGALARAPVHASIPQRLDGHPVLLFWLSPLRRSLDIGVVLGALASIEHAVVAHEPDDAMADARTAKRARRETSGSRAIAPGDQKRKLSFVVNAGEHIIVDRIRAARTKPQKIW
jgi:hypothetical protein